MELTVTSLYQEALALGKTLAAVDFSAERVKGSKRFKDATFRETEAFLRDFPSLVDSKGFSDKELGGMLANTCLETASFLYAAGAPTEAWRSWAALAGSLLIVAQQPAYAMQLLAIARRKPSEEPLSLLRTAPTATYREGAIQRVIFHSSEAPPPSAATRYEPLDDHYRSIVQAVEANNTEQLLQAITGVVTFWLEETGAEKFEPGQFPVFESEINAVVAALAMQGVELPFRSAKVKRFLQAGLE